MILSKWNVFHAILLRISEMYQLFNNSIIDNQIYWYTTYSMWHTACKKQYDII